MTSPLWAPVTARRAFAPPNEETETSVVCSVGFYCCSEDSSLPWTEHDRTWHDTVHSGGGLVNGRGERNASCALAEHCREKEHLWFDRETWIFSFLFSFFKAHTKKNKTNKQQKKTQNTKLHWVLRLFNGSDLSLQPHRQPPCVGRHQTHSVGDAWACFSWRKLNTSWTWSTFVHMYFHVI